MKKIITTTMIAMSFMAFADGKIDIGTNVYDAVEYCTEWGNTHTNAAFYYLQKIRDLNDSGYASCDALLSKNKNYMHFTGYTSFEVQSKFPLMVQNAKEVVVAKYPNCSEAMLKMLSEDVWSTNRAMCEVAYASVAMTNGDCIHPHHIKYILSNSSKFAKAKIRKEGKSFVGDEGTALVKTYVDSVADAFNAPKYSGLNQALKNIDMDFGIILEFNSKYTDEQIRNLKEDILNGSKDFTNINQNILKVYLGVEEYNKFVKEYNGDK